MELESQKPTSHQIIITYAISRGMTGNSRIYESIPMSVFKKITSPVTRSGMLQVSSRFLNTFRPPRRGRE